MRIDEKYLIVNFCFLLEARRHSSKIWGKLPTPQRKMGKFSKFDLYDVLFLVCLRFLDSSFVVGRTLFLVLALFQSPLSQKNGEERKKVGRGA